MSDQHETSKPIMATDVMKRIEALELGYRDAKATNAEIQDDVDRIDGAVAELLEWCKRLSREQTAETEAKPKTKNSVPASILSADDGYCSVGGLACDLGLYKQTADPATKAETQPTDTASEDEIMGREFDLLRPGDVIENALGERFAVMEIANGSSVRKGTIRMRHVLHTGDYPSSECRRERYVEYHWRRVVQSKHEEPTEPPLQWVEWHEGMTLEDGCYPVMVRYILSATLRWRQNGEWFDVHGDVIEDSSITHYFPVNIPHPPKRD